MSLITIIQVIIFIFSSSSSLTGDGGLREGSVKEGPCAKDDQATFNYKWTAQIVNHAEDEDNDDFDDDLAMKKENNMGSFIQWKNLKSELHKVHSKFGFQDKKWY